MSGAACGRGQVAVGGPIAVETALLRLPTGPDSGGLASAREGARAALSGNSRTRMG